MGIDAGTELTRFVIMDERKKVINKCSVSSEGDALKKARPILFCTLEDSAMILGVGITGSRRYNLSMRADSVVSDIIALAAAGRDYMENVKSVIDMTGSLLKIIRVGENGIDDFCSLKFEKISKIPLLHLSSPSLLLGDSKQYAAIKKALGSEPTMAENPEYFSAVGACLSAKEKIDSRNAPDYTGSIKGDELNFKTINCNGCESHCAVSALMFNGQIKATFGALCGNPHIYNNLQLKKI